METEPTKPKDIAKPKDATKGKILLFIIGVLVGAVISTAAFFVYAKMLETSNHNSFSPRQLPTDASSEMFNGRNDQGGTPPAMPSDNNSSQNNN